MTSLYRRLLAAYRRRTDFLACIREVEGIKADVQRRLHVALAAVEDRDAFIRSDPQRSRAWDQWRTRHPVRVVERRQR